MKGYCWLCSSLLKINDQKTNFISDKYLLFLKDIYKCEVKHLTEEVFD